MKNVYLLKKIDYSGKSWYKLIMYICRTEWECIV